MPVKTNRTTSNQFGIEVTDGLVWQGWEPGGEYTKHITLKNVHIKTKKLKYRIPNTRFFTTKYPQPIVLSSGTSIRLPVTFRPLEKDIYEDKIEFATKDGNFHIPMKAVLPEADLILLESLNFGLCAVKDHVERSFEIYNSSVIQVSFQIEAAAPFLLTPSSGTLAANTRCIIKARFKPQAAYVYQIDALCNFGPSSTKSFNKKIKLEGIGKYSHIGVKYGKQSGHNICLDFGSVALGSMIEKTMELINYTPVNAPFQIIHPSLDTSVDNAFTCSLYHGAVPASGSLKAKVSFKPTISGVPMADNLEVLALGATSSAVIKCIGEGKGYHKESDLSKHNQLLLGLSPDVVLSVPSISFGVLDTGGEVSRSFQVINVSDVPAVFQFQIDCDHSVFRLNTNCGKLKGGESQTIIVTFRPHKPIVYYRRLVCLIHNQIRDMQYNLPDTRFSQLARGPLYLDMFGTCHSGQIKPDVMQRKHLERYKKHESFGLTRLPPEEINTLLNNGKISSDEDGYLSILDEELKLELSISEADLTAMEEFFSDGSVGDTSLVAPHISLDTRQLDFGRCSLKQAYQKTLNVTNHTQGKVTCMWMSGDSSSFFSVTPEDCDILPLRSASFRVTFKPNSSGQFFSAELEGYVFYKSMRDHRLVEDNTFSPPWCVTLGVSGHTFPFNSETFLPKCDWDSKQLIFPPVIHTQSAYKTLCITNEGTNPVDFSMEDEPLGLVSCKPFRGLLCDKYQVIALRFSPDTIGTCKKTISCKLNDTEKYSEAIHLIGSAEIPQLLITPEDIIYFKPTCLSTMSHREIKLKNLCRIPLRYEWKISAADKKCLSCDTATGYILPNEILSHEWSFKPDVQQKYLFKVKLFVSTMEKSSESVKKYTLRFAGKGQTGSISCEEEFIDFGNVVVGTTHYGVIHVRNNSDCSLHYHLWLDQSLAGSYSKHEIARDMIGLELDHYDFLLPARSKKAVKLTLRPSRRARYTFTISYELRTVEPIHGTTEKVTKEKTDLCTVRMQGVYPTLAVSDIRATGFAQTYSRVRLWNLFSVDRFNMYLDGDPSAEELMYTVATRHSTRRRMPVHTRAILDFNFGSAPYMAEPCTVYINLANNGTADTEWMFLFPPDLQLEMEYWAETGQFDDDELHEMYVIDNDLFSIQPRKGKLSPGQATIVTLTYKHNSIGTNRLPVLFKIIRGREVLLNFHGTTISQDERYLHFSTTKHMFEPLPIGGITPPVQNYYLFNGGGQTLQFELELDALDDVQKRSCGWRIFECLTPNGEINPGQNASIQWVFSPLEARTYSVDVPVNIIGGETTLLTFTGVGYDPSVMGGTMSLAEQVDVPVHIIGGETTLLTFTGVGYDPSVMGGTMSLAEQISDCLPEKQLIPIDEQLLYLSKERIHFGNIPLFTDAHQLLFLRNSSTKHHVSFRWMLDDSPAEGVIHIWPNHGYIQPGECVTCKVTFNSNGPPAIYNLDIICEVTDETLMGKYNKELIDWHDRQEEKRHLFTITESDIKVNTSKNPRPASGPTKLQAIETDRQILPRPDSDLRKYEALPPIDTSKTNGRRPSKDDDEDDPQPTPPDTFVVHLGVTGRSFSINDFYSSFIDEVDTHFVKSFRKTKGTEAHRDSPQEICSKEEHDILSTVLPMLLRDLLQDKDFKESLEKINQEPIPYFNMLREKDDSLQRGDIDLPEESHAAEHGISSLATQELMTEPPIKVGGETQPVPSDSQDLQEGRQDSTGQKDIADLEEREILKRSDELRCLIEETLENTLHNLLTEASHGEISLTARPRLIALPPSAKGNRKI